MLKNINTCVIILLHNNLVLIFYFYVIEVIEYNNYMQLNWEIFLKTQNLFWSWSKTANNFDNFNLKILPQ